MKKIMIIMLGVLIIGGNVFAQGNLVVQGNLGVGQSIPAAKMHVESTDEVTAKTVSYKTTDTRLTGYDIDLIDNVNAGTSAFAVLSVRGDYQGASGSMAENTQGIDYQIRATGSNTNTLGGAGIELKGFNGFIWIAPNAVSGYTFDRIYGLNFNMRLRGANNINADDIVNFVSRADLVNNATVTATNVAHFLAEDWNDEGGTGTYNFTNVMGMRIDKQTVGTNRMGIWMNGNDAGADIVFGPSKEISVYRDSTSGQLYVSGATVCDQSCISDRKFKDNIKPIESSLDTIMKIKGISFTWKQDEYKNMHFSEGKHYGVIAQELEQVLPELVSENSKGEKNVAYKQLIPVLIEAMKEQQKTITDLSKKIDSLEIELKLKSSLSMANVN